jgi:hypothetical protein
MKSRSFILFVLLIIFGLSLTNSYSQIATNGLVGYYPFNNNAKDESGNSFDATLYGATLVSDKSGNINSALLFDGVVSYATLPVTFDTIPLTINVWFNAAEGDYTDWRFIYELDNPDLVNGLRELVLLKLDGKLKLFMNVGDSRDTVDIMTNVWYNASMVIGADSTVKYYLNSNLIGTKNFHKYLKSVNGYEGVVIGVNRSLNTRYCKGKVDDIRIYNRELSQSELESIYYDGACISHVSVTDTLIIDANLTGSDPVTYLNTLKIYPNPAKDYLRIDCGENYSLMSDAWIKISNSLGQVVFHHKINQQMFNINLSGWTGPGLYLVYILDSSNSVTDVRKIIIE